MYIAKTNCSRSPIETTFLNIEMKPKWCLFYSSQQQRNDHKHQNHIKLHSTIWSPKNEWKSSHYPFFVGPSTE